MSEQLDRQYMDAFGFDLGDGESAVAWFRMDTDTEPQMLELSGQKSVVTAVARLASGGVLIGANACRALDPLELHLRFKSKYLTRPEYAAAYIRLFAGQIARELTETGRLRAPEDAVFAVGCPSGWNEEQRQAYRALLREAGLPNARVISESRAAFLYSRESGELRVSAELLNRPTLIIDAGSSTTDFTYVRNLTERRVEATDFGETLLGGGLIEKALWRRVIARSPRADELKAILSDYPQYDARCEMEARKVKEMYFVRQQQREYDALSRCESSVKLHCVRPPMTVDIECTDEDMDAILNARMPELGGKSFIKAYGDALIAARDALGSDPPRVLLMTGGASRMRFMRDMAQEVFPDAALVMGIEPEFAIARGLAYALRIDARTRGFVREVDELIASDQVERIVTDALPRLFTALSEPLAEAISRKAALPAFERWRSGQLSTLEDMGKDVSSAAAAFFEGEDARALLAPILALWLKDFMPKIEALTDPICDRYHLPRTALRLSAEFQLSQGGVKMETGSLVTFESLHVAIDLMMTAIFATLMGGGGVALISTGPIGLVIGAVIGLIVGVLGARVAERAIKNAVVPVPLRRAFSTRGFERTLARKKDALAASVYGQLMEGLKQPSPAVRGMIDGISGSVEAQLKDELKKAVLLIH